LNMLRVFKPASPMNLGVWTLLAFSGVTTAAFLREVLGQAWGPIGWLAPAAPARFLAAARLPLPCPLGSYTRLLLSPTTPPAPARAAVGSQRPPRPGLPGAGLLASAPGHLPLPFAGGVPGGPCPPSARRARRGPRRGRGARRLPPTD